jgi:hypothetical protein
VTGSICATANGNASSGNHIESIVNEFLEEHGCCCRIICVVAVHKDIDISLDIGEHAPNNIAFAPPHFAADNGAGGASHLSRSVF